MVQKQKAFTLIELLIVIAIIGILASIVLVSLNGSRIKARDTQRKSDINSIHKALETYFTYYGSYPAETWCDSSIGSCNTVCPCAGSDWNYTTATFIGLKLRNEGFFTNLPKDPINNTSYFYDYEPINSGCPTTANCKYDIRARLEGGGNFILRGGG